MTPDPIDVLIRRMERCEQEREALRAQIPAIVRLHPFDPTPLRQHQQLRQTILRRKLRLAGSAVRLARAREAERLTREAC